MTDIRVGNGFDVHAFAEHRKLILGGVQIDYPLGLAGHSDADVVVHAIMDALLGAAGMGDIGRHFPDTDVKYKDIDSLELLRIVVAKLAVAGWKVSNVDATIIAQKPKLAGYFSKMEAALARELKIDESRINVKATTTERLGFIGREEGIAALASAVLSK